MAQLLVPKENQARSGDSLEPCKNIDGLPACTWSSKHSPNVLVRLLTYFSWRYTSLLTRVLLSTSLGIFSERYFIEPQSNILPTFGISEIHAKAHTSASIVAATWETKWCTWSSECWSWNPCKLSDSLLKGLGRLADMQLLQHDCCRLVVHQE